MQPQDTIKSTRTCRKCGQKLPRTHFDFPPESTLRYNECRACRLLVTPRRRRNDPRPEPPLCACGCGERLTSAGCRTRPLRFRPGHHARKSVIEYVIQDCGYKTPCWIWQRGKGSKGYGIVKRKGKNSNAHRFVYERAGNVIPDGLELDHLCFNPSCVNPDHMEPVTHAENMRRRRA